MTNEEFRRLLEKYAGTREARGEAAAEERWATAKKRNDEAKVLEQKILDAYERTFQAWEAQELAKKWKES